MNPGLRNLLWLSLFAAIVAALLAFVWPLVAQYAIVGVLIMTFFVLGAVAGWRGQMGWAVTLVALAIAGWYVASNNILAIGALTGETTVGSPAQQIDEKGRHENATLPGWVVVEYPTETGGQQTQTVRVIGSNLNSTKMVLLRANNQGELVLVNGRPEQVHECLPNNPIGFGQQWISGLLPSSSTSWKCSTEVGGGYHGRYLIYLVLPNGERMHVGFYDVLGVAGINPVFNGLPVAAPNSVTNGWPAPYRSDKLVDMPEFQGQPVELPPEYQNGGAPMATTPAAQPTLPGSIFAPGAAPAATPAPTAQP